MDPRNAARLRKLVTQGKTIPTAEDDQRPGRFPIENREDLQKAIRAVGRVRPDTEEARAMVRKHIIRRAAALRLSQLIPPTWRDDGTLKT